MSWLTKLRSYVRVPFVGFGRRLRLESGKPPPDDDGSAGVHAKLKPPPPVLAGGNARPWPPDDHYRINE